MIPVLVRMPQDGSHDYVIGTSPAGKADLADSTYFKKLWNGKQGIVIFDAYCSGETAAPDPLATLSHYHTSSRALLWLGRTLYGEWCKEYALLTAWTRQTLKAENIELFGYKESGVTAILLVHC